MSRKIYIDSNFRCHVSNSDGMFHEVETSFFDGKCDELIEGYRFIPAGAEWTNEDGIVFTGEMIAPWKPCIELHAAQAEYQYKELLLESAAAYQEGVNSAYDQ